MVRKGNRAQARSYLADDPEGGLTRGRAGVRCVQRMWKPAHMNRRPAWVTRCLGGFLVSLVLFLVATEASPAAHKAIHQDSANPEHQCAVTMFAQGAEPAPSVVEVSWFDESSCAVAIPAHEFTVISEPAHLRPPASGPPVA